MTPKLMVKPLAKMLAKAFLLMLDSMAKPLIVNDAKVGGEGIVDGGGDAAH